MGVNISIVQGRVTTRKEGFDKIQSVGSVGPSGATADIDIGGNAGSLVRLLVRRTAGPSGENFTVRVFDDPVKGPEHQLFEATSEGQDRMDLCRGEMGRFGTANGHLYLEITSSTAGQAFQIRLQGDFSKL